MSGLTWDPAECDEPLRGSFAERGTCVYDRGPQPSWEPEFFLGAHRLNWCWEGAARGPLFVNMHLLLPRVGDMQSATQDIGLDSGGYEEVARNGCWRWNVARYVELTRRACRELRRIRFAAIQDWLCTPAALRRTGLSVAEHQARTLASYLDLSAAAPEIPWCPVLQGAEPDDFRRHRDDYERAGIYLPSFERVMVGSIAARDDDPGVLDLLGELADSGVAVHALGAKGDGLRRIGSDVFSGDSMAWSARGKGIHRNLCAFLGVDLRTKPAVVLEMLRGRVLPPARAAEHSLLATFGPDPRRPGEVQSLANSQSFSEHWRAEQLAIIAGACLERVW